MSEPDFPVHRNAISLLVSREMMLDLGLVEPTEDEAEERARSLAAHRQEVAAAWAVYESARAALDALTVEEYPIARRVLDLHAPVEEARRLHCRGCDVDGYEWEHPQWPCRTVEAVAETFRIELPAASLLYRWHGGS